MCLRSQIVVLDEAHERTLPTEILFGLMKQIQVTGAHPYL